MKDNTPPTQAPRYWLSDLPRLQNPARQNGCFGRQNLASVVSEAFNFKSGVGG